jgi:hypothetical protein
MRLIRFVFVPLHILIRCVRTVPLALAALLAVAYEVWGSTTFALTAISVITIALLTRFLLHGSL